MESPPAVIDVSGLYILWIALMVGLFFPQLYSWLVKTIYNLIAAVFSTISLLFIGLYRRCYKNAEYTMLRHLSEKSLLTTYAHKTTSYGQIQFAMYNSGLNLFSALCPTEVEKAMQHTWPKAYARITDLRNQGWQVEFASKETRKNPNSICFNVITYLKIVPPVHLQQENASV